MALPESLVKLTAALGKLPGIGPRSAERIALHLVQQGPEVSRDLAAAIVEAREKVGQCCNCGALTDAQPCRICSDPRRDRALLCVVERATDLISIEKSGSFRGAFHVLGGKISPVNGVGPEDLRISELEKRLEAEPIKEIILALPSDVEGDATSFYLARQLKNVKVSRIAHGLPVGSGLEFADELTLTRAIEGRRQLE